MYLVQIHMKIWNGKEFCVYVSLYFVLLAYRWAKLLTEAATLKQRV